MNKLDTVESKDLSAMNEKIEKYFQGINKNLQILENEVLSIYNKYFS